MKGNVWLLWRSPLAMCVEWRSEPLTRVFNEWGRWGYQHPQDQGLQQAPSGGPWFQSFWWVLVWCNCLLWITSRRHNTSDCHARSSLRIILIRLRTRPTRHSAPGSGKQYDDLLISLSEGRRIPMQGYSTVSMLKISRIKCSLIWVCCTIGKEAGDQKRDLQTDDEYLLCLLPRYVKLSPWATAQQLDVCDDLDRWAKVVTTSMDLGVTVGLSSIKLTTTLLDVSITVHCSFI